jgi:hypothetical protein
MSDFSEDDGLSRDALRVSSGAAIEHRWRRRRYCQPQLSTTQLASLFRDVANRLQRSVPVPRRSTPSTTTTTTQTPTTREAGVQCQLLVAPDDDEEPDELYGVDPTETEYQTPPTFVHNVINRHGHPVKLYVALLPLTSPTVRPTLKIQVMLAMPPQIDDEEADTANDSVTEQRVEH